MTKMSDENVLYYQGGTVYDKNVTKVIIATGVTIINDWAFMECKKIQSVVFEEPHQVTEIGNHAFYDCYSLESIELPKPLKKIGGFAFRHCYALRRIVIPGGATSFGWCAFAGSGIEEVFLSDGIESISCYAFADCPRLHTLRLPASLKEIHGSSFDDCPRLENVIVPADGLPLLKRLNLDGSYQSRGWEAVCKMAQKAPNLTRLSLRGVRMGQERRYLDDNDIPLVLEMVSSCPLLESLDLSNNAFSDQAIRTLDSEGILGRLRDVNFRHNSGTGSTLSSNEFPNLLQKNLRLAIWTERKWENPEDECFIRHYLDMNRFGCRGGPITNVSIWPRLIHRLGTIGRRRQLKTCPVNVLFHLLREGRGHPRVLDLVTPGPFGPDLLDEEDGVKENEQDGLKDDEGDGAKRRRLL